MTHKDILESCRAAVLELRDLEEQLTRCLPTGAPSSVKAQQYDAPPPGTNDPTAAALQLYEGLMAQRDALALQVSRHSKAAWNCIKAARQPRDMVILSNYYLLGMTDAEIAHAQDLARETICRLRRSALAALDAPTIKD